IDNKRTVHWSGQIMRAPLAFKLDGKEFDPLRTDQTITVGTTELWTLVNEDVFQHPFHLHVNPFQVVKVNGEDYPEPDVWWDTFALPSRGTVTVRIFFRPDVIGPTVFLSTTLPTKTFALLPRIASFPPDPPPPPVPPAGPFPTGRPIPAHRSPRFAPLRHRSYVFTQLYPQLSGGAPARVVVGRRVEVQLPGAPTRWTPSIHGDVVRQRGDVTDYPSVGQYDRPSAVVSVPFDAAKRGSTTVTLGGSPAPPPWLEQPFVIDLDSR